MPAAMERLRAVAQHFPAEACSDPVDCHTDNWVNELVRVTYGPGEQLGYKDMPSKGALACEVREISPGSQAEQAGLKAGAHLVSIDASRIAASWE